MVQLLQIIARTRAKRAPQIGDRPFPESKSVYAPSPPASPAMNALDKWHTEVSACVAKRERDAKISSA